jgi:hypothetical protein
MHTAGRLTRYPTKQQQRQRKRQPHTPTMPAVFVPQGRDCDFRVGMVNRHYGISCTP